jgi:hypothetical protein
VLCLIDSLVYLFNINGSQIVLFIIIKNNMSNIKNNMSIQKEYIDSSHQYSVYYLSARISILLNLTN